MIEKNITERDGRYMPDGVWPRSTSTGRVSVYEGTVEAKRIKVDLEVGDSAGEYWLDFGDEEQRDPGYLEYVISANGIAHVIPLADISSDANEDKIAREVDDLRLVAHLKQQIRGAASAVPLLLVLSKVDLVVPPLLQFRTGGSVLIGIAETSLTGCCVKLPDLIVTGGGDVRCRSPGHKGDAKEGAMPWFGRARRVC